MKRLLFAASLLLGVGAQGRLVISNTPTGCKFPVSWTRVAIMQAPGGGPISPLGIMPDPSVIHDGATYKMWFTGSNSLNETGIAYATSTDNLNWTLYAAPIDPDPTMTLVVIPPASSWDTPGIETAAALRIPTGEYMMWYTGDGASTTFAIGLATSSDGVTWTQNSTPVLQPSNSWEQPTCTGSPSVCSQGGVLEPTVIWNATAGQYMMWYAGLGTPAGSFLTYRIGEATSPDGITWTRQANPVLPLGTTGTWDAAANSQVNVIADPRSGYHMLYFGSSAAQYVPDATVQPGAIGHAWSLDGLTWTKDPNNPILSPRAGQVDAWSLGGPSALIENGLIKVWYSAYPTDGLPSSVVLATAPCGG